MSSKKKKNNSKEGEGQQPKQAKQPEVAGKSKTTVPKEGEQKPPKQAKQPEPAPKPKSEGGDKKKKFVPVDTYVENETVESLAATVGGGAIECPKGMRDFTPLQMQIRKYVIEIIRKGFARHGAVEIQTPTAERSEILLGQYGEEGTKLIYRLRQEAAHKEQLSLRYDLTVPMVRYMHCHQLQHLKRYQFGNVFRRDKPKASSGRFREFMQCDFDIAGKHQEPRFCDAECAAIMKEILNELDVGPYVIKTNHRKILNGMMALCAVKDADFSATLAIIDSLDKITWEEARQKLLKMGHTENVVTNLARYCNLRGPPDQIVQQLEKDDAFMAQPEAKAGLNEMKEVFKFAKLMNAFDVFSFDLSLARGLTYYTGIVYEGYLIGGGAATPVVNDGKNAPKSKEEELVLAKRKEKEKDKGDDDDEDWSVVDDSDAPPTGAIIGGGRYDQLFRTIKQRAAGGAKESKDSKDSNLDVPAVGFSIGIERLFSILEKNAKKKGTLRENETMVYVASAGKGLFDERVRIISHLWKNQIAAEMSYGKDPKPRAQAQHANSARIPFMVWTGPDELKAGVVTIKDMRVTTTAEDSKSVAASASSASPSKNDDDDVITTPIKAKEIKVPLDQLVSTLQKLFNT
jgi:histidyl-tRNA synthetase